MTSLHSSFCTCKWSKVTLRGFMAVAFICIVVCVYRFVINYPTGLSLAIVARIFTSLSPLDWRTLYVNMLLVLYIGLAK